MNPIVLMAWFVLAVIAIALRGHHKGASIDIIDRMLDCLPGLGPRPAMEMSAAANYGKPGKHSKQGKDDDRGIGRILFFAKGFRRTHGGGGGGGGGSSLVGRAQGFMGPFMISILGGVAVIISLTMFTNTLAQIDSDITLVAGYAEQASSVQLISPLTIVIFLAFLTIGIGLLTAGGVVSGKKAAGGGMLEIFMAIVMAGISTYIAFLMYGMSATGLHTAYTTVNASVNKTYFASTLQVMGIGGMLLLIGFVTNAMGSLVGAGIGGWKMTKGMLSM